LGAILYEINTLPWTYAPPLPGGADAPTDGEEAQGSAGADTRARSGYFGGDGTTVLACAFASAAVSALLTRLLLTRSGRWHGVDKQPFFRGAVGLVELPAVSSAARFTKRQQYQPIV